MSIIQLSAKNKCAKSNYDAVVIGSGPNGLSAAIVLAQKGMSVLLIEAQSTLGGGCRSGELTLPGYKHDLCSSIFPLGIGSPFFRTLPLEKYGLSWIQPTSPYAHPFADGKAAIVERSIEATATTLGADGPAYVKIMNSLKPNWQAVCEALLQPTKLFEHPLAMAKFGRQALLSAEMFVNSNFHSPLARGLFAGVAAHATMPLDTVTSASIGLVLGTAAHAVGWPMVAGGSQNLTNALIEHFSALGGEIISNSQVISLDDLPAARLILCDITPKQLLSIFADHLPAAYCHQLKLYRYGPGCFKIDWALEAPIPWQAEGCRQAGTVHLGGTYEEIAAAEKAIWQGNHPEHPFVLLSTLR